MVALGALNLLGWAMIGAMVLVLALVIVGGSFVAENDRIAEKAIEEERRRRGEPGDELAARRRRRPQR